VLILSVGLLDSESWTEGKTTCFIGNARLIASGSEV
jgi:hypothetical protein